MWIFNWHGDTEVPTIAKAYRHLRSTRASSSIVPHHCCQSSFHLCVQPTSGTDIFISSKSEILTRIAFVLVSKDFNLSTELNRESNHLILIHSSNVYWFNLLLETLIKLYVLSSLILWKRKSHGKMTKKWKQYRDEPSVNVTGELHSRFFSY